MKLCEGDLLLFLHKGLKVVKSIEVIGEFRYGSSIEDIDYETLISKGFNLDFFWNPPNRSKYSDAIDINIQITCTDGSSEYLFENDTVTRYVKTGVCFSEPYSKFEPDCYVNEILKKVHNYLEENYSYSLEDICFVCQVLTFFYFYEKPYLTVSDLVNYCTDLNTKMYDLRVMKVVDSLVNDKVLNVKIERQVAKLFLSRKVRKEVRQVIG